MFMIPKEKKIKKILVGGVCSVGLIGNADATNQIILELPIEKSTPESIHEPVRYNVQPPGEFRDVDLPDELKKEKQLYLTENINRSKTAQKSSTIDKKFSIQVAMFKNRLNAERYEKKLLEKHLRVYLVEKKNKNNQLRYYIRIGHYQNRQQAETVLKGFIQRSGMQAYIVSD